LKGVKRMKGLIVVGHGSRSKDARDAFFQIVEQLREGMGMEVESCFMEISEPFIPETIDKMYSKGIKEITVLPYFLFSGIHIKEDIPEILLSEKSKHTDLQIFMAQPFGYHEAIIDILKERASGELSCI
jgi:sirohydrochlorin cobaltochelatase